MTQNLLQDLRHALRGLARRPLVSGVAIVSLALGIGVNSAIFSAFERIMLRRLAVPAASELVDLRVSGPRPGNRSSGDGGRLESVVSYPLFKDLQRLDGTGLGSVFAHRDFGASVSFAGQSSRAEGILVSGSYFSSLRLTPALGRLLGPEDDRVEGGHPVVVLAHAYWSTRFGADRSVVGSPLVVNGEPVTIVGVAPEGFSGTITLDAPEVFVPLAMARTARLHADWDGFNARNDHWLYVSARLAPGISRSQAEQLTNARFAVLTREVEFPLLRSGLGTNGRAEFLARRLMLDDGARGRNSGRDEARLVLVVLFAVTGLVLAIAAANVANLLLARGADRAPEIAVRLSLGASSGQLVRLLLIEAVALGALGGIGAVAVAQMTLTGLMTMFPSEDSALLAFGVNTPVLLFSIATGLRDRARVRPRAGAAQRPGQRGRRPAGPAGARIGLARRPAAAHQPGDGADRPGHGAAGAVGTVSRQPGQHLAGRHRDAARRAGDVLVVSRAERLLRRADRGLLRSSRRIGRRHPGRALRQRIVAARVGRQQPDEQRHGGTVQPS